MSDYAITVQSIAANGGFPVATDLRFTAVGTEAVQKMLLVDRTLDTGQTVRSFAGGGAALVAIADSTGQPLTTFPVVGSVGASQLGGPWTVIASVAGVVPFVGSAGVTQLGAPWSFVGSAGVTQLGAPWLVVASCAGVQTIVGSAGVTQLGAPWSVVGSAGVTQLGAPWTVIASVAGVVPMVGSVGATQLGAPWSFVGSAGVTQLGAPWLVVASVQGQVLTVTSVAGVVAAVGSMGATQLGAPWSVVGSAGVTQLGAPWTVIASIAGVVPIVGSVGATQIGSWGVFVKGGTTGLAADVVSWGTGHAINVNVVQQPAGGASTSSVWTTPTSKGLFGPQAQVMSCTLASLANGGARQSNEVDNSTSSFLDALVMVQIKANAAGTSSAGVVELFAYANWGDGSATRTDVTTGTDAGVNAVVNARMVGVVYVTSNGMVATGGPFSVAQAFGGILPPKWGLIFRNKTGAALDATETNHAKFYTGIFPVNQP